MHEEKGFEDLILKNTTIEAMQRFAKEVDWPEKVTNKYPKPEDEIYEALKLYFRGKKAEKVAAEFLVQCEEEEIPEWLKDTCIKIRKLFDELGKGEDDDSSSVAELDI